MQKSLLNVYIQKVAAGDESYLDRLCKRLADRLVIVPLLPEDEDDSQSSGVTRLNVYRIESEDHVSVPIFSNDRKYRAWASTIGQQVNSISLLGADFCAALGSDTWMIIDAGSDPSVELPPDIVQRIALIPPSEQAFRDGSSDDIPRPERPTTREEILGDAIELTEVVQPAPVFSESPPKSNLVGGQGKPTKPSSVPKDGSLVLPDDPQYVGRRGHTSTSIQRPVIFSAQPSEAPASSAEQGPKKKKSLLGFLKSVKR